MGAPPDQSEFPSVSEPDPDDHIRRRVNLSANPLKPGQKIGDFEIQAEIGRGGMGVVYKAREQALERVVALKHLHPFIYQNPSLAQRFRTEAVLAANLSHPNIVQIYQIEDSPHPKYFTMEYVQGVSLRQKVEREGFLKPDKAIRIILQACEALEHAHQHNIIHRDIKPGNILLENHIERVRITDFGIARDLTAPTADEIAGSMNPGTPAFMSPEQIQGEKLDVRTDIFSLGMTLYYMLTGRLAYQAKNRQQLLMAFQNQKPRPSSRFNPDINEALDNLVLKMIVVETSNRYNSCEQVVTDLDNVNQIQSKVTISPAISSKDSFPSRRRFLLITILISLLLIIIPIGLYRLFISSPYILVDQWGGFGAGDGQFDRPLGMAIDNSDFIYVADLHNHRVQKFNTDGTFIAKFGSRGSGPGQFERPKDVAVDKNGNIYITDSDPNRVQKLSPEGRFLTAWDGSEGLGEKFSDPVGIAVGLLDRIYVVDHDHYQIQVFDPNGVYIHHWGGMGTRNGQFDKPIFLAIDDEGYIYVTDSSYRVQKFDSQGNFIGWWGRDNFNNSGWHDSDSARVAGAIGSKAGEFNGPKGITVDSQGDVYVTELKNRRVQKFSAEGDFICKWGGPEIWSWHFKKPHGIVVDSSGYVYVADHDKNCILKFALNTSR